GCIESVAAVKQGHSSERNVRVNRERFQRRFEAMSAIGQTPRGGVHRLALTDEDKACRDLLASWCREAGFRVEVDRVGSLLATRPGRERDALPFLIGSHLASQ